MFFSSDSNISLIKGKESFFFYIVYEDKHSALKHNMDACYSWLYSCANLSNEKLETKIITGSVRMKRRAWSLQVHKNNWPNLISLFLISLTCINLLKIKLNASLLLLKQRRPIIVKIVKVWAKVASFRCDAWARNLALCQTDSPWIISTHLVQLKLVTQKMTHSGEPVID